MSILVWILVGLIAGAIAGFLMGGRYGLLGSIIVGILGAFIGGFFLDAVDVAITTGDSFINATATASIGAIILIALVRFLTPSAASI